MALIKFILATAVASMVLSLSNGEDTVEKPTIQQSPIFSVIYTGEEVIFTCKVKEQSPDWKFYWYKTSDKSKPLNSDTSTSSYTINAAQPSDSGTYMCQVQKGNSSISPEANHDLTVKSPPEPKVIQTSGWERVFPGEKVILKCEIPDKSTDWKYVWLLNNNPVVGSGDTLTFSSINQGQGGQYTCQTELQNRPKTQVKSPSFTLTVYAGNPNLRLETNPSYSVFYIGEQVTLTCEVQEQSPDWKFYWYKASDKSKQLNSDPSKSSYTINAVQVSDTYVCRVKRGDGNFQHERNLDLTVKSPPEPKVIQTSGWQRVFPGEKVVLKCEIPDKSTDWKYVWLLNNNPVAGSGDTLAYSSINKEQGGDYTCQTELQKRPKTQKQSPSFTLTVYARKPTVRQGQNPAFSVIYIGEQVTLTCEVQEPSSDWKFYWYKIPDKSNSLNSDTTTSSYTINAAKVSDSGTYVCRVKRGENFQHEVNRDLTVKSPPQPNIIQTSGWKMVFPGEKVTLKCEIPDKSTDWKYMWLLNNSPVVGSGDTLTIPSINHNYRGNVTCQTELQNRPMTQVKSPSFTLTVYAGNPTLLLGKTPSYNVFYTGEQVTLTCEVQEQSSDWKFYWYKTSDKSNSLNSDSSTSRYTINAVQVSDNGTYVCRVKRGDGNFQHEKNVDLTVKSPPKPKVIQTSGWQRVFPGEKVILKCEILDKSPDWKYVWLQNNNPGVGSGDTLAYSSINKEQGGDYTCQTELQKRPKTQVKSSSFTLTVYAGKPTLLLGQEPTYSVIYTGEQVTLTCEVQEQSSDWKFYWYKTSDKSNSLNSDSSTSSYTINAAQPSDSGTYVCRVKRGDGNFQHEKNVDLAVKSPPKPKVIQTSGWERVFAGEKVVLKCEIPDKSTDWKYVWLQNNNPVAGSEDTLTYSSINKGQGGDYTCQTELQKRPKTQVKSSSFTLTVYEGKPTLLLGQEPTHSVIFPGEQVTLTCKVQEQSSGWKYHWYKIPDKSKHLNSDTSTSSYSINAAQPSDDGTYVCRVIRGENNFQQEVNRNLTVKNPPQPKVSLTSGWDTLFTEEEMTVKCEVSDTSGESWKKTWFKDSKQISSHAHVNITGNSLSIQSAKQSDAGSYTCDTELEKRPKSKATSTKFSLTVHARPQTVLTLETSWTDIMSVDTLTLKCEVQGDAYEGWNYTWYKDGVFEVSTNEERYSVKATEETFESEYKCRGNRTERPLYSSLSEGFRANKLVLKRKILLAFSGCVVCSIILLIIGCIVLRVTRKPEKKEAVKEDLFISMTNSKTETSSPLQEYLKENGPPLDKGEHNERPESAAMDEIKDAVVDVDVLPAKNTGGFSSFQVEKSAGNGLKSEDHDESAALLKK